MFVVLLVWAAYIFLGIQIITHRIQIAGFVPSIIILVVAFFVLVFWSVHHLTKPGKKAQRAAAAITGRQAAPSSPSSSPASTSSLDTGSFSFRVAGVTFENDNGESRQEILRHMKFGDSPWADDPDNLTAELEETEFDGEQAFAVLVNGYQVGYVPKTHIKRVAAARENVATCFVSSVRITGGGTGSDGKPLSYGCEITLDY